MMIRGVRGATTVNSNTREDIVGETEWLLKAIIEKNNISVENIASVIFSVTDDLNAEFPAVAARNMGWIYTPLFCTLEIPVPDSLRKCIRVLLHINSDRPQKEMKHVYLNGAERLRPDIGTEEKDKYYSS